MNNITIERKNKTESGNALLGIIVIIIVFIVGGIFFWNNYQIQIQKNEELKKQASIVQTQVIVQPDIIESTSTATSTVQSVSTSTKTTDKNQEIKKVQ